MKNWEKYEEEVKEMNYKFGVVGDEIKRCYVIICKDCIFSSGLQCNPERIKWLYADYEEPKLTKEENTFLRCIMFNFYIARDENGNLSCFTARPTRGSSAWMPLSEYSAVIGIRDELFPFITWESKKAWSIEELMELKAKE